MLKQQETILHDNHTLTNVQLNSLLSGVNDKKEIVLRVDAGAEFGAFVTVVDALKRYSLERVSILTWKEQ